MYIKGNNHLKMIGVVVFSFYDYKEHKTRTLVRMSRVQDSSLYFLWEYIKVAQY